MRQIFFLTMFFIVYTNCFSQNREIKGEVINCDTIYFDTINKFDREGNSFSFNQMEVKIDIENNVVLKKKEKIIEKIMLDPDYEGPGYLVYYYTSKKKSNKQVVIIEASADIGIAWYYFILIENDKILKQFYIREPRHNSENINIKHFFEISTFNKILEIKSKRKYIADYSEIPKNLKKDKYYIYLYK